MLVKEDGCVENNGFGELTPHTVLDEFPLLFLLYKIKTLCALNVRTRCSLIDPQWRMSYYSSPQK